VAGALSVFGAVGAGAIGPATPTPPAPGSTSGPVQNDCTSPNPQGPGTIVNPTVTAVSVVSPDSELYPTGATAAVQGVLSVTIPGAYQQQVISNLPAIPGLQLNAVGVTVKSGTVNAVDATGAVKGSFTFNFGAGTLQTGAVNTGQAGTTFTVPIAGSVTTSGSDGDIVGFVPGAVIVDGYLDVAIATQTLACNSAVVNNQDATVDAGEGVAFGLPVPAAPAAAINLVATNPTVPAQSTTVSSASPSSTYQATANSAVPQISIAGGGIDPSPSTGAAITNYAIAPASATGTASINASTGLITYLPPNNQFAGPETFTVTVTDALGAQGSGVVTLNVVAGDATNADVTVAVSGANGAQLFIPKCGANTAVKSAPCPTISLTAINLNGRKQTSTGSIGQITVVDARGLPLPWSLTAKLAGDLQNQAPPSGSLASDGNNRIESDQLTMQGQTCAVDLLNNGGGLYSTTTAGSAGTLDQTVTVCQAAIGQSGGTFLANANLSLNVNPDIYVGTYLGTINFLLA
jgi:hypothetical protein